MTHDEFEAIAASRTIGAASAGEERSLDTHLLECAECRRAAADYDQVASVLALSVPPVMPPGEVRDEVMRSVRRTREDAETGGQHARPGKPRWVLAATAVFAVGCLTLSLMRSCSSKASRRPPMTSSTSS